MRGVGQFDAGGDFGGLQRRCGKVRVQRFGRVEFGIGSVQTRLSKCRGSRCPTG